MDNSTAPRRGDQQKKVKLKDLLPEFAVKTGLSQEDVAKVCRLLMNHFKTSIENDEVFVSKMLTLRSSLQQAKPATEKRKAIPERRIGRLIINEASKETN